jgi:hypothetical protein
MVASCLEMFKTSTVDEVEIQELVDDFLLVLHTLLQWRLAKGKDIQTPNTIEIVVMKPYFQREFGLPSCDFFCYLLDHFKIELGLFENKILGSCHFGK